MAKRSVLSPWTRSFQRSLAALTRSNLRTGKRAAAAGTRAVQGAVKSAVKSAVKTAVKKTTDRRKPPSGAGEWLAGMAVGLGGVRRYRLYRPPGMKPGDRLPLLVMLHGCGQDANGFARSTRMNAIAAREGFLVLYPEQDRLSNPQGCWNWFDTRGGRAYAEAALIMSAIDQACLLYRADPARVAVAGLSAGASMAALLAARHPARFKAVAMHSGVPPGTAHSTVSAVGAMYGLRGTKALAARTPATLAGTWPPLLVIHGSADHTVLARNGQAAVQAWADAAQARAAPARKLQRGKRHPATVTDFKRKGSTVATLVEVGRLGHAWSGGAAGQPYGDALGPDASRMVWAFAARQFRGAG